MILKIKKYAFPVLMLTFMAYLILMLIRNMIIYDIRTEAIDRFYINDPGSPYSRGVEFNDYGSYDDMMYDFKGWNFNYFYPNLQNTKNDKEALRRNAIKN